MIDALRRLGGMQPNALPSNMAASGISDKAGWSSLFSSHPSMEDRIAALQGQR
jgi:heat shock protein HtpX